MLHVSEEYYSSLRSLISSLHASECVSDWFSFLCKGREGASWNLYIWLIPSLTYQTGEYVVIVRSAHVHSGSLTNERRNARRGEINNHLNKFSHRMKPEKKANLWNSQFDWDVLESWFEIVISFVRKFHKIRLNGIREEILEEFRICDYSIMTEYLKR